MSKLVMLAGGSVEPGRGAEGAASAYVVLSAGPASRLFKVHGPTNALKVVELPGATTLDLQRLQRELEADLMPLLLSARAGGGAAALATPAEAVIFAAVEIYLKAQDN